MTLPVLLNAAIAGNRWEAQSRAAAERVFFGLGLNPPGFHLSVVSAEMTVCGNAGPWTVCC